MNEPTKKETRFMREIEDYILEADEEVLAHIEKFASIRREQINEAKEDK